MYYFKVEVNSVVRGRGNNIYKLTTSRKLIEGCGMVTVYGVSCSIEGRPETEHHVDDISSNIDTTLDTIYRLARQQVNPYELYDSVASFIE